MPDARLHFLQSGLAKSPCRGFATRNLTGVGKPAPVLFSHRLTTDLEYIRRLLASHVILGLALCWRV
jgi:hypothetical protein